MQVKLLLERRGHSVGATLIAAIALALPAAADAQVLAKASSGPKGSQSSVADAGPVTVLKSQSTTRGADGTPGSARWDLVTVGDTSVLGRESTGDDGSSRWTGELAGVAEATGADETRCAGEPGTEACVTLIVAPNYCGEAGCYAGGGVGDVQATTAAGATRVIGPVSQARSDGSEDCYNNDAFAGLAYVQPGTGPAVLVDGAFDFAQQCEG